MPLPISMVTEWLYHQYQESNMFSTTPTHTDPECGNTTSTKSLTFYSTTPPNHTDLSMVTPPVPRV